MTNIVLLHYNNYFNRIVKQEGNYLSDYSAVDPDYELIENINFNPNDGVSTSIILGKYDLTAEYDYLLVTSTIEPESGESGESDELIISRWFILDTERTRDGQYNIDLKRDVIVDHYDDIKNDPIFIEKGIISDVTDPLLYNSESMTYNQIKDNEFLLKDRTGCGWVVGYIPQDAFSTQTTVEKDVILQTSAGETVAGISNWDYFNLTDFTGSDNEIWATSSISKKIELKTKLHYPAYVNQPAGINWPERNLKGTITVPQGGTVTSVKDTSTLPYSGWSSVAVNRVYGVQSEPQNVNAINYVAANMPSDSTLWTNVNTVMTNAGGVGTIVTKTQSVINNVINLNGQTLYDSSTGLLYLIEVVNVGDTAGYTLDPENADVIALVNRINNIKASAEVEGGVTVAHTAGDYTANDIKVGYSGEGYKIKLTQVFTKAKVKIDNNRNKVIDAQYDMFCIPYADDYVIRVDNHTPAEDDDLVTTSKLLAIGIAEEIAKDSGSGSIYDVQLLPYCPAEEILTNNNFDIARWHFMDFSNLSRDLIKDDNDKNIGAIVWCSSCTRIFDIDEGISVSSNAINRKVESECDMYRLCSGNYQGIFEFNAAKGYGVNGFRVDCTFKPFNPYIHVIPKLGGLYGANFAEFKDARGLICGGDFSLSQMSNEWANYELQNKNYQNIFDRQIQNMDVNNSIAKQEAAIGAISGIISSTASGAASGMKKGPGGAIAGAAAGFATSAVGGILDYANLVKRQEEAKSYATDMYGYNLGNIQAIPTSLAKNSALNANTKIFPFVEKYTCTDTEKQALRDKMTYNGMTIMKIGTMSSFIGTGYFKGQMIRFNNLKEDTHMANAIYEEINKGVYI